MSEACTEQSYRFPHRKGLLKEKSVEQSNRLLRTLNIIAYHVASVTLLQIFTEKSEDLIFFIVKVEDIVGYSSLFS